MHTTLVSAVAIVALFASTTAFAQQPPAGHQHDPSQSPPAAPGRGGMGGMHPGGMSGMMGGGRCDMMGGMGPMMGASPDPKTLSRMLQLRGEIMKAVGEILIKHARDLEAAPAR